MNVHREEHLDLCAAYALGSLDEADRAALEAHLNAGCAECESALTEFSAATVLLGATAPPARPSPELRERVLRAAAASPRDTSPRGARSPKPSGAAGAGSGTQRAASVVPIPELRPTRPRWGWGAAAAAAVLLLIAGWSWKTTSRLRDALDASQLQLQQLQKRFEEEQSWFSMLNSPEARVAVLAPTPAGDGGLKARAVFDPASSRALVSFSNLRPPQGRAYQLWALHGARPASLGVIQADARGNAVMRLEEVADASTLDTFAVSLEREGGSPNPNAPTGPVVMVGKLAG